MGLPAPKRPAHKKRLKEWESWLNIFYKQNLHSSGKSDFSYIPNAAWLLNDLYWQIVEQYVRPTLVVKGKSKERIVHPYKIASASEITIMMTDPLVVKNKEVEKKYNALFAWFVATQIIGGWETGDPIKIKPENINLVSKYKEHITNDKFYPETVALEHIKWLINLNTTIEKPLSLNAQFWRLFYLSCLFSAKEI